MISFPQYILYNDQKTFYTIFRMYVSGGPGQERKFKESNSSSEVYACFGGVPYNERAPEVRTRELSSTQPQERHQWKENYTRTWTQRVPRDQLETREMKLTRIAREKTSKKEDHSTFKEEKSQKQNRSSRSRENLYKERSCSSHDPIKRTMKNIRHY